MASDCLAGSFGSVFLSGPLATKHSHDPFFDKPGDGLADANVRECAALCAFAGHPHIIPLKGAPYFLDGRLAFDMPRGVPVEPVARERDPSDELFREGERAGVDPLIAAFFAHIGSALAAAHAADVAHRDVKPSNIVTVGEKYVLADWGLAGFASSLRTATTDLFTPGYRAPELVVKHKKEGARRTLFDHRASDMWALGISALELFVPNGVRRTLDESPVSPCATPLWLAEVAAHGRLSDAFGELHPLLEDLLVRIFVRDPAKRITAAELCRHPYVVGHSEAPLVPRARSVCGERHTKRPCTVSPARRETLFDWLTHVACTHDYGLRDVTLFAAFELVDRYLAACADTAIPKAAIQKIGCACLAVASSLYEPEPLKLSAYVYMTARAFTEAQLVQTARDVCEQLEWDLFHETAYTLWRRLAVKRPPLGALVVAVATEPGQTAAEYLAAAYTVRVADCRPGSKKLRELLAAK